MDNLMYALDLVGVAVFATSGGLKASQKQMDLFGFILVATVTGIGGGTLRDLLLGIRPVFWVAQVEYLGISAVLAIFVFFVAHRLRSRQSWLVWADAVGLATFCIVGSQVALTAGTPVAVAVLMGVMTATFGGVIRDVLCGEIPLILRREVYATAAALGALVYVAALGTTSIESLSTMLAFVVALTARGAGIVFQLSLPSYKKE